jgi:hypothetical protein
METAAEKRLLVISFISLIQQLSDGEVTLEQLRGAIFYTGRSRQGALKPLVAELVLGDVKLTEFGRLMQQRPIQTAKAFIAAFEALLDAEAGHRVLWTESGREQNFRDLNQLLRSLGMRLFPEPNEGYSQPAVFSMVEDFQLPYQVVGAG